MADAARSLVKRERQLRALRTATAVGVGEPELEARVLVTATTRLECGASHQTVPERFAGGGVGTASHDHWIARHRAWRVTGTTRSKQ